MKVINVGRHPDNDIVIDDHIISRNHLRIKQHNDGHFTIEDIHSTNGTYVNGKRIAGEVKLQEDDIVRIGKTVLPWKGYFNTESKRGIIDIFNQIADIWDIIAATLFVVLGVLGIITDPQSYSYIVCIVVGIFLVIFRIYIYNVNNNDTENKE